MLIKNLITALNLKNQKNSHGLNLLNSINEISKNALILIENEPSAINILKSQTGKIYKLLLNTYFNFYFYLNIDKKFSYPWK